jgi:hypothetical protein
MQYQHDATTIRYPSIANLMVDSADRNTANSPLCNDFSITRSYSMLNGAFTRVATTEVVFEWDTPNLGPAGFSGTIRYDAPSAQYELTIPTGFYTVEEAINVIVALLNSVTAAGNPEEPTPSDITWTITANTIGGAILTQTGAGAGAVNITQNPGDTPNLINALFGDITVTSTGTNDPLITTTNAVDLRPYRYVDIISQALTYAQDVKDSSTALNVRDVLCRWYFDYDTQATYDGLGYPILMGYKPFCLRRIYNPPKQIKWDQNLPISGVMDFALYDNNGKLAKVSASTNFLMTLQVSEN